MTDILFDPITGDLLIEQGELVVGNSLTQHQYDIVVAEKGHYHHAPRVGVGIRNYLHERGTLPGLNGIIRAELVSDGQDVAEVSVQPGGVVVIN